LRNSLIPRVITGLVVLGVSVAACGSPADDPSSDDPVESASEIEVPDVTGEDGADAVLALEDVALTASLEDQDGASRDDGSGCTVEHQAPTSGNIAASGDAVTLTLDCRAVDWENEEGSVWDEFTSGYEAGFDEGCQALFDLSPDGSLYEDDTEYTSLDCPSADVSEADKPVDVPDEPESEGSDLGFDDGCDAIFDDVALGFELYHGDRAYTADDCKAQGGLAGAPAGPDSDGRDGGDPSRDCPPARGGGTYFAVRPVSAKIKCAGATALWKAYLSAAPTQGVGSSGYTEIDGWGCLAAKIPEAPRLGSCSKGSSEFAVYEFSE
jgi:hypothetical protein